MATESKKDDALPRFPACICGTAHQLLPNLFVSSFPAIPYKPSATESIARKWIHTYKIKHVVNCTHRNERHRQLRAFDNYPPVWLKIDPTIQFHQIDIEDRKTTTDEAVIAIVETIRAALAKNEAVMVHCAAGRGRSGTISAIVTALELNMEFPTLLKFIDQQIQTRTYTAKRYHKPNPLNEEQQAQVERILEFMMKKKNNTNQNN